MAYGAKRDKFLLPSQMSTVILFYKVGLMSYDVFGDMAIFHLFFNNIYD